MFPVTFTATVVLLILKLSLGTSWVTSGLRKSAGMPARHLIEEYLQRAQVSIPPCEELDSPQSCPTDRRSSTLSSSVMDAPGTENSMSPAVLCRSVDATRYPRTIIEKRCKYNGCIHLRNNRRVESCDYDSSPIQREIEVIYMLGSRVTPLKRCNFGPNPTCQRGVIAVTVGCTCTRRLSSCSN